MRSIFLLGVPLLLGAGSLAAQLPNNVDPAGPPETFAAKSAPPPALPEKPEYSAWIRDNAHPIASLTSDTFPDLRFLAPLLAGKRVVQLGESSHGVGEFDDVKVRLIRYLHEELGYDVIAFESSLYECFQANEAAATLPASALMQRCIFTMWQARETLPLFEYILRTRRTAHPLVLAGFDDQQSSAVGAQGRPAFFAGLIRPLDPARARQVAATDSGYLARHLFTQDSARAHEAEMAGFYDALAAYLRANRQELARRARVAPLRVELAARVAHGLALFVRQLAVGPELGETLRDRAMADNLDFLLDGLYPGQKVITWSHNTHLMRRHSAVRPDSSRRMGEWVSERRGGEVYTIGVFMYRGRSALNDRTVVPVAQVPTGSLENILAQVDSVPAVFVDLDHQRPEAGNAWMFQRIPALDWGTYPLDFVPREQFDGLLLVREVGPPHYLD